MTSQCNENGELLPDEIRLTRFDKFLRSTSMDELPELFNILKGEMSVIGPRPLLIQYLKLYSEHQKRRHEVRPGLSWLAQISGRNTISWEEKFNLDVNYVDNISFVGGLKIIFRTLAKVLRREGVSQLGEATMQPFKGSAAGDSVYKKNGEIMVDKRKLLIIGASGHGRVVADIALKTNRWKNIAFLDDDENIKSTIGIEVIGKFSDTIKYINDFEIFVAIGNNQQREKMHIQLKKAGANIPVLIHPSVILGEKVEVRTGTVVMPGAIINSCSKIGEGCIVNTGATIDHDNIIEDFVHISPGVHLAGMVTVGKRSWLCVGVTVSNNVAITSDCIIGAGAVVVKDITEPGTYVGVPAKRKTKTTL